MTAKKRMGGMSLSNFGMAPKVEPVQDEPDQDELVQDAVTDSQDEDKPAVATVKPKRKRKEVLTTLNIKIERKQQRWLQDTSQTVRDNNDEPVPPSDRVYPQHLIQVAVELLKSQDVSWDEIKNVDELRKALGL